MRTDVLITFAIYGSLSILISIFAHPLDQSIGINTVFYGGLFILYIAGIYQPSLTLIAVMFAGGTALDSILTFGMFVWMIKKTKSNSFPWIISKSPLSCDAILNVLVLKLFLRTQR